MDLLGVETIGKTKIDEIEDKEKREASLRAYEAINRFGISDKVEIYSAKSLFGAWYGFKKELDTNQDDTDNQLSKDEVLISFAQKLRKRAKTSQMKGGTKACI